MRVELFCCSGGMALGFRRAGIEFDLAVDQNPDACDSYARNMGERPVQIDVRELVRLLALLAPIEGVELLVADPPCTPWSRAGKREGLDDERDMLRETAAVIDTVRPRCWLVGNVPGLDDAPNWPVVQQVLGGLQGYCIDYARFDAADFGVPQHRIRPFWFGHPRGTHCIRWPTPTHGDPKSIGHADLGDRRLPWVTCRRALAHLTVEQLGQPVRVRWARQNEPSRIDEPGKVVPSSQPGNRGATLSLGRGDHQPSDPDKPARTMTRNALGDGALLAHPKHPINRPDEPSCTVTARDTGGAQGACAIEWPWDRPSTTLTTRDEVAQAGRCGRDGTPQSWNAIKLSERAAAILQGFPESWHFVGKTKRARWSQIGQAMPAPLAQAVAQRVAEWLAARAMEAA